MLSVFPYSNFRKNRIWVLFEDRKVHFARMGEAPSVQLWFETVFPPTTESAGDYSVTSCWKQMVDIFLGSWASCSLSHFLRSWELQCIRDSPFNWGGFPLTVWIWEQPGARSSCLAVLSQDNVPCGLHLCQHSYWRLKLQSWCVPP